MPPKYSSLMDAVAVPLLLEGCDLRGTVTTMDAFAASLPETFELLGGPLGVWR